VKAVLVALLAAISANLTVAATSSPEGCMSVAVSKAVLVEHAGAVIGYRPLLVVVGDVENLTVSARSATGYPLAARVERINASAAAVTTSAVLPVGERVKLLLLSGGCRLEVDAVLPSGEAMRAVEPVLPKIEVERVNVTELARNVTRWFNPLYTLLELGGGQERGDAGRASEAPASQPSRGPGAGSYLVYILGGALTALALADYLRGSRPSS
jgi:hypothetical protein